MFMLQTRHTFLPMWSELWPGVLCLCWEVYRPWIIHSCVPQTHRPASYDIYIYIYIAHTMICIYIYIYILFDDPVLLLLSELRARLWKPKFWLAARTRDSRYAVSQWQWYRGSVYRNGPLRVHIDSRAYVAYHIQLVLWQWPSVCVYILTVCRVLLRVVIYNIVYMLQEW
jgi:hypothetical protein